VQFAAAACTARPAAWFTVSWVGGDSKALFIHMSHICTIAVTTALDHLISHYSFRYLSKLFASTCHSHYSVGNITHISHIHYCSHYSVRSPYLHLGLSPGACRSLHGPCDSGSQSEEVPHWLAGSHSSSQPGSIQFSSKKESCWLESSRC
jgi:hypothetical protein